MSPGVGTKLIVAVSVRQLPFRSTRLIVSVSAQDSRVALLCPRSRPLPPTGAA